MVAVTEHLLLPLVVVEVAASTAALVTRVSETIIAMVAVTTTAEADRTTLEVVGEVEVITTTTTIPAPQDTQAVTRTLTQPTIALYLSNSTVPVPPGVIHREEGMVIM